MFSKRIFLSKLILILCLAALNLTGAAANQTNRKNFTNPIQTQAKIFRGIGVIKEIDAAEKAVKIKHEKIEGLMEAMTMVFEVKSKKLLNRLKVGDKVEFQLTEKSLTVVKIRKIK